MTMTQTRKVESFRLRDSTQIKLKKLLARYSKMEYPPTKTEVYNRAIEQFCDRELGKTG